MAYTKTTWANSPAGTSFITADNLNNIENGLFDQDARITVNESDIDTLEEQNEHQEILPNALKFNGISSKGLSGSFTSFDAKTIYIETYKDTINGMIASFNNSSSLFIFWDSGYLKFRSSGDSITVDTFDDGLYKIVLLDNGSYYDIFVNGVKQTLSSFLATTLAITKLAIGLRENGDDFYNKGNYYDVRLDSTAISEADALALTGGTKTAEEVLPASTTNLVYTDFDSITTITNSGTTASANLTGTDLELAEDITNFGLLAENGQLLEDKYVLSDNTINTTAYTVDVANPVVMSSFNAVRTGKILNLNGSFNTNTSFGDGTIDILTIDLSALGITKLVDRCNLAIYSDAGGASIMAIIDEDGQMSSIDTIPTGTTITTGKACYFTVSCIIAS